MPRPRTAHNLLLALLLTAPAVVAQQHELSRRDLEEMFYADTLPPAKPKPAVAVTEPRVSTARPKPAPQPAEPVASTRRRAGVKYRIQLMRDSAGVHDVSDNEVFRSNDKVRFDIESNIDGYLYVIQKGSSGTVSTLFPHEGMDEAANRVHPNTSYTVPGDSWFVFDNTPGLEQVMVILTRTPLQSLPARPVSGTERNRFPVVMAELQQHVQSRDLKLFSEQTPAAPDGSSSSSSPNVASIVINTSADKNDSVYAEILLKHQ